jgi:hypothetical protein
MSSGAYDAEPALPCDLSRPYGRQRPIRRGVLPESKAVLLERESASTAGSGTQRHYRHGGLLHGLGFRHRGHPERKVPAHAGADAAFVAMTSPLKANVRALFGGILEVGAPLAGNFTPALAA